MLSLLAAWGCGGDDLVLPPDTRSLEVQALQGDDQVGLPGARLADPLIVRLVDEAGDGVPDRAVVWVVNAGGGTVNPATGTTDAEGFASAEWILGSSAGPNTVDARVPDVGVVTFTAIGNPDGGGGGGGTDPSAAHSTIAADPAAIEAGSEISTIIVTVLDEADAPVPGVTVTLEATGEGNTLTQPAGPTGADGIAVGALQSTVPGEKVVSARLAGLRLSRTVTVTVTPRPAARIESIEGDDQEAPAGAPVPVRAAVRVVDDQGQPVPGITVSFVVTAGGGRLEGAEQTTNAEGIARVGQWTLGTAPGTNTLEARAGTLEGSPVIFTAEAVAAEQEVARLVFLEPPRDVAENESFTVKVALVDADGDVVPLSGIIIYVGLFPEGSEVPANERLRGETFENTVNGVAELTLGIDRSGRYRLRALTDDLPELGPHGPEPFLFSELFEVD
jgi:hypothetical protein